MPYKTCPKCTKKSGVRTQCCECGYPFFAVSKKPTKKKTRKPKRPKPYKVDWTTLKSGDHVVVKLGPYWKTPEDKKYMGERGKYTVRDLLDDGFIASPKGETATVFIYMGPTYKSKQTGIIMRKHLVKLIPEGCYVR